MYSSKKQGRWYPDVDKIGIFQNPSYIYEDGSRNCYATGPTNLEVALAAVVGVVTIVLAIIF